MTTDYNPYQIIPETTANQMAAALNLAIEMAKKSFPHLVDRLEFTKKRYEDTARGFTGSQNIPAGARLIFRKDKQS